MTNKFAERLVKARESAGYNKKKFAELLGNIHPSNISNWERGKNEPKLDMIIKISHLLDVSVEYLVGEGEENSQIANEPRPHYGGDKEYKKGLKELEELKKVNDRLLTLTERLQNNKEKTDDEMREMRKENTELLWRLARIKGGEDVDL